MKIEVGRDVQGRRIVPTETPDEPIAGIVDEDGRAAQELQALYGRRITPADELRKAAEDAYCVVCCEDENLRSSVDWQQLDEFAERGGTVIASLDDYAEGRRLRCVQRRRNRPHALIVEREHELFRGCELGDEIPWYNVALQRPLFRHYAYRYIIDALESADDVSVLARSRHADRPVAVEEERGDGRIIALDLLGPQQEAGGVEGSRNKWVFAGNILGDSVRYSRWWPDQLKYDSEYRDILRRFSDRFDGLSVDEAPAGSDDSPIYTVRFGRKDAPTFMLVAVLHGWEVMNAHGLLRLIEYMHQQHSSEPRIAWLMENFQFLVLPIMNPWGYRHAIQTNANDCDLNRNFPECWQEYGGDAGWRGDYPAEVLRGKAPFSEPETQVIKRHFERENIIGLIDYHQHGWKNGHTFGHPDDAERRWFDAVRFAHELAAERLKNRFLRSSDRQLQLRLLNSPAKKPFLRRWADSRGAAAITQETVGLFEHSFSNGEVVAEVALAFCQAVGVRHKTESTANA